MKINKVSTILAIVIVLMLVFSNAVFARTISNTLTATFNITDPSSAVVDSMDELKAAIADANVNTILISAGTYVGQLEISRNVALIGQGDSTIIQAGDTLDAKFTTSSGDAKPIIYITGGASVTIENLVVDGAGKGGIHNNYRFMGIGFYNAGGTVKDVKITDIRDNPLSGMQHGVGIYAYNDNGQSRDITVSGCTLTGYQKNGMALSGNGLTVDVSGNTVIGAGPINTICQNGIQVSYGAKGSITNNTIKDHMYTKDDEWKGGACGILLYDAGECTVSGNTFSGNDNDYYNNKYPDAVTLTGEINGTQFGQDGTLSIDGTINTDVDMNITATVNDPQAFTSGDIVLDFGDDAVNVTVNNGQGNISPENGKFKIGTITNEDGTKIFENITLTFAVAKTYTAKVYVDGN